MPAKGVSKSYPIGKRFGRVTVSSAPISGTGIMCRCDCGDERKYYMSNLNTQVEPMCPDCRTASRPSKGMYKHPLFATWKGMKDRCLNTQSRWFHRYGGRGVLICDRWLQDFRNFAEDMGERPDGTTIDRIDKDGNYEPGNCRWAVHLEQQRNRSNNAEIEWGGRKNTLTELAEHAVVDVATLSYRLRAGWELERAMITPSGGNGKRGRRKPLDDDGNPV